MCAAKSCTVAVTSQHSACWNTSRRRAGELEEQKEIKPLFRELNKLLCYDMTAKTMLEAICRRLGFTFALASNIGRAAIWEHDSGFINWIPVNLQQWFGFLSHTVLSPVPSISGGQHTLVSSFSGRFLHFPSFCLCRGAPGPLLITTLPAQHR